MTPMKVLLIGGGGREHAIAQKIKQSPLLGKLFVYPGNGGFDEKEIIQEKLDLKNKREFQNFIRKEEFDLVIVGPEDPLVAGMANWTEEIGIPCFGPSAYCAQIEGSKEFAKNLMTEVGVPTAKFASFDNFDNAVKYTEKCSLPLVVKADGLAAGKGVSICLNGEDVQNALKDIFINKIFGDDGKVVIEEFMEGEEASVFALCDGENFVVLPAAQDHKRAFDGDLGPNTGGMGAYCPAPIVTPIVEEKIKNQVISPVIEYFKKIGYPYRGLLYAGLMIKDSEPKVVEFNCRFGDPETQAVLLLLEDDLLDLMLQCSGKNSLKTKTLKIKQGSSVVVVMAAEGYPGKYKKNIPLAISKNPPDNIFLFHAGTRNVSDQLFSNGGRILAISAVGNNLKEAVKNVYFFLDSMEVSADTFYRKDIAWRAL